MTWIVEYLPEAEQDFNKLDNSQKIIVRKSIYKVQQNPLPQNEGGYGKSLGNHNSSNLKGLLKIKLKNSGLRIVYSLKRIDKTLIIVVIGIREDSKVYSIASKRKEKYNLK